MKTPLFHLVGWSALNEDGEKCRWRVWSRWSCHRAGVESEKLHDILHRLKAKDIYNADETNLFWKMLPENTLGFIGSQMNGAIQAKTHVTVLVSANTLTCFPSW